MPDNNNPNEQLLLEEVDKLKAELAATNKRLDQVIEFNRQLLSSRKPENNLNHDEDDKDTKAAKEKLEKFIGG